MLLPAAAATAVLADPITRLVYERGAFGPDSTELVGSALFWFSFSLPFSGVNLLLTRTFFSLQRPWITTALAGVNITVNILVSVALYGPFGVPGIVIGTAVSSLVMAVAQATVLRRLLHGSLEGRETALALVSMLVAAAGFGAAAWGAWAPLDAVLGRSLVAQLISVGGGLAAGAALYAWLVVYLRIPEAEQLRRMIAGRLGRAGF
jgi:putative peptidoglycan lipid II flippase